MLYDLRGDPCITSLALKGSKCGLCQWLFSGKQAQISTLMFTVSPARCCFALLLVLATDLLVLLHSLGLSLLALWATRRSCPPPSPGCEQDRSGWWSRSRIR